MTGMIGDYQIFLTPRFLQQLLAENAGRNAGGPFVLAVKREDERLVEVCELQSEVRDIVNARFERRLGTSEWTRVPLAATLPISAQPALQERS